MNQLVALSTTHRRGKLTTTKHPLIDVSDRFDALFSIDVQAKCLVCKRDFTEP